MKILIIEDDKHIADALDIYFTDFLKVECCIANTIEEGVASIKSFCPNLILLDLIMQGKNAIEVISKARKIDKDIKVAVVSALNAAETIAKDNGADYFLAKPFDLDSIEEIIKLNFR